MADPVPAVPSATIMYVCLCILYNDITLLKQGSRVRLEDLRQSYLQGVCTLRIRDSVFITLECFIRIIHFKRLIICFKRIIANYYFLKILF